MATTTHEFDAELYAAVEAAYLEFATASYKSPALPPSKVFKPFHYSQKRAGQIPATVTANPRRTQR